jgi:DNA-binding winged helix-turn-helix (wHTH) protein
MEARSEGHRRISLVVEAGSARVAVDGQRVVIARRQAALLAELALHAGEAVEASELIKSVWDERPGMTLNDLHVLVKRVRRRLEELSVDPRLLVNVKGVGYLLDPKIADVTILDSPGAEVPAAEAPAAPQRASAELGAVDPTAPVGTSPVTAAPSPAPPADVSLASGATSVSRDSRAPAGGRRWLAGAITAILASVAAGFVVGNLSSDPPERRDEVGSRPPSAAPRDPQRTKGLNERTRPPGRQQRQQPRRRPPAGSGGIVAGPAPIAGRVPQKPGLATAPPTSQPPEPRKQQSVELPPPPTRYLYHLYNPENGDHFVTTDGGAVTQHEAKGYEGGAIGRVYTTSEKNTKAIALNHGSAFVFIDASPKTDPASVTAPLWYSTNNAGDFFYTTSKSEASQEGWSATLIGYVRPL